MTIKQQENSKLLWVIIGSLVLITVATFAYFNFSSSNEVETIVKTETTTASEAIVTEPELATSETIDTSPSTLITESILKDAIPENKTLAEEEVAKLNDIQNQLNEQEQILKDQHADADQLIELKEEQIKLLEAQLATSQ